MIGLPLAAGVVDVHAHWLPEALFDLPPGAPYGPLHDRDGELHLGEVPLSVPTRAMSDVAAIRADMAASGLGVRVLSAPPFAFPVAGGAPDYVDAFNEALGEVVGGAEGTVVGLGTVVLDDPGTARVQLERLAATPGISGVAIPPLVAGASLDRGPLRHVLADAAALDLAVLVHPMQLPRPEWADHYLANLVGNPVETATAIAAVLLGGVQEQLPDLRICFVHGGGCAPGLLGRWDHGWRTRADVRRSSTRPPSETFGELYVDTVTHDPEALRLLVAHAGKDRLLCGSDHPFDMAQADPVGFATSHGADAETITANARAFLGA
ncbi:amidohydrolase family protein [Pseudonocardia charpentierae]|uniref:Amidohydrolase family protein n=1 Tax=Pseudonocardia charpentierae TaxID=3075545 RepID=A0ABU2N8F0_9PSEU|nr:amidohydrolase family protein [Pseudonocardia sp. DSM 45834]MDT0349574.1 amidohydrolase family protein [Pseudonocardia sp. DSM 45834]